MKTYIEIAVRAFPVKVKDERNGRLSSDAIILEKSRLQAAQLVGIDSKELIYRIYNRQGFKVLEIGKPVKRDITIDLEQIYTQGNKTGNQESTWYE